jgi:hypothetical protein
MNLETNSMNKEPINPLDYATFNRETGEWEPTAKLLREAINFAQLERNDNTGDWEIRNAKLVDRLIPTP